MLAGFATGLGALVTVARADEPPQSATGHVQFVNAEGNDVAYSFSAVNQPEGGVGGEIDVHVHRADGVLLESYATTICVTVTGNIARIGATVDRLTADKQDVAGFSDLYITVVDNGEGANAPPDLATNVLFGPTGTDRAIQHCTTGLPRPLFAIETGNVQVR